MLLYYDLTTNKQFLKPSTMWLALVTLLCTTMFESHTVNLYLTLCWFNQRLPRYSWYPELVLKVQKHELRRQGKNLQPPPVIPVLQPGQQQGCSAAPSPSQQGTCAAL
jgi:hypothetical protein